MCGAQMNYNTCLDYLKYNSAMLQTNHFINMCSCSRRKPILKEANLKTAWLAHISLQNCQSKLNKCPWKNFSHREISSDSLINYSVQFSMDCSMPGFPVHHQLLEITQNPYITYNQPSVSAISLYPPFGIHSRNQLHIGYLV